MNKVLLLTGILLLTSCTGSEKPANVKLEFRIAYQTPGPGLTEKIFPQTGEKFYLKDSVLLSNSDIVEAIARTEHTPVDILLKLSDSGAVKFTEITAGNIGRRMAILLDGNLITAPVIRDTISQGVAVINGDFTRDEAERIALGLSAN